MQTADTQAALALEQALDQTLQAVLSGDLAALAGLEGDINLLRGRLPITTPGPVLERLHRKAARNATCLHAAARGLRAAKRRIAEIQSAHDGLAIYDDKGKRSDVTPGNGKLAQRF